MSTELPSVQGFFPPLCSLRKNVQAAKQQALTKYSEYSTSQKSKDYAEH